MGLVLRLVPVLVALGGLIAAGAAGWPLVGLLFAPLPVILIWVVWIGRRAGAPR